jgi:hypothetical protein
VSESSKESRISNPLVTDKDDFDRKEVRFSHHCNGVTDGIGSYQENCSQDD